MLVAAGLLALQALAALVYAVLEVAATRSTRPVVGLGTGLILLAYAVALVLLARGAARGRRWSRGPVVVTQLILLLLGWSFREPPTTTAGVVLGVVGLVVLVCVLLPSSTAAFLGQDGRDRTGGAGPPA